LVVFSFRFAVASISADPISVFCGGNTRCLYGWSGAYSNSIMRELWYLSTEDQFKSNYAVKAKTFILTDIAHLY